MKANLIPSSNQAGQRTQGINQYLKELARFGYKNGMDDQAVFEELMDQPDLCDMIPDESCRSGYVTALLDDAHIEDNTPKADDACGCCHKPFSLHRTGMEFCPGGTGSFQPANKHSACDSPELSGQGGISGGGDNIGTCKCGRSIWKLRTSSSWLHATI